MLYQTFWRRINWQAGTLLLLVVVTALGCQTTQHQKLYFAAMDLDQPENPPIKYYRLLIDARSTNARSEFAAGSYNANALRELYGGVPQGSKQASEQSAGSTGANGTVTYTIDPSSKKLSALPPDSLYAIFYGSNADAMAKQVQDFADSAQLGNYLGGLLGAAVYGDKFADAQQATALEAEIKAENAVIEQILNNAAAQFKANRANFQGNRDAYVNALGKQLARSAGIPEGDVPDIATNRQGFIDFLVRAMSKLSDQQHEGNQP